MSKTDLSSVKEQMLLEGINEIEKNGIQSFSLRKIAANCGLSCAAPYKHFENKQNFISEIIKYINKQWNIRQEKIISQCENDPRSKLTEISLEYIKFLVENSHFRSIIMLKDKNMDYKHIKMKSELSNTTKNLIREYCDSIDMSPQDELIKTFIIRSIIYGAALMFDNGELDYTEKNFRLIAKSINREFDLC